jgi:uncharacterized protein (DUF169 family)
MTDWRAIERRLVDAVGLRRRPVAVAFRGAPPSGVARFAGRQPSGCSFWARCRGSWLLHRPRGPRELRDRELHPQHAAAARAHAGARLHDRPRLSRNGRGPGIPRLPETPAAVDYAPLGETPVEPDVVLVAGQPGRLMLLFEAGTRGGVTRRLALLGRPTCMALPATLAGGPTVSPGCVGNRVYNGLHEDELYVALPGREVPGAVAELDTIAAANSTLADYHTRRRAETGDRGGLLPGARVTRLSQSLRAGRPDELTECRIGLAAAAPLRLSRGGWHE